MGRYTLTYIAVDAAGNSSSLTRSIFVYEKQAQSNVINPGNKVVYLTFDDGPGVHTARLLDILDKYGVKATFFVTNQFPAYQNMIGETYRRGHTIALHTYSHAYNTIYCNEDAYYNISKNSISKGSMFMYLVLLTVFGVVGNLIAALIGKLIGL